jgi:hypothetical protein
MSSPSFLRPARAVTPMAFVRAIVQGYARYGKDPAEALKAAQITPRDLARPGARVTAAQFEALSGHAMQELDDEALGWFSRRLPWGSYGMLCRASLSSPDLGVAIKRWCRHHRLLTEDIGLALEVAGGVATLRITENRPLDAAFREFCLVTSLRFMHGYMCWAIDSRISLRHASFPFEAPPHRDAYAPMFTPDVQLRRAAGRHQLRRALPGVAPAARRARVAHHAQARAAADHPAVPARPAAGPARARAAALTRQRGDDRRGAGGACSTCPAARCTGNCTRKARRCRC